MVLTLPYLVLKVSLCENGLFPQKDFEIPKKRDPDSNLISHSFWLIGKDINPIILVVPQCGEALT